MELREFTPNFQNHRRSDLKVAKTQQNLKNVDTPTSKSKGYRMANKSQKIRKTRFCRLFLLHGYLQSQKDLH